MEALTLYWKASILGLERRGSVRKAESATVGEYRRLLSGRTSELGDFETLAGHYEPGIFGRRPPPPEALADCDRAAARLAGAA